jgi:hypothetical protein
MALGESLGKILSLAKTAKVTKEPDPIFSISNFKTAIGKPVRPNLFRAILRGWSDNTVLTLLMNSYGIQDIKDFPFRCEKAELPGRSIATSDDTGGGGPALKLPYDVTYNDIQISIICSADMKERIFFESWIDSIVGPAGKANGASTGGLISYFEDYARGVTLEVQQLDEAGEVLISYLLYDVYPTVISPMNATWEEVNSYQRFGVTLFYRYYEFNNAKFDFSS